MYPYHEVLSLFQDDIEYYVVDAHTTDIGIVEVTLTVLVDAILPEQVIDTLDFVLRDCMTMSDINALASDLGYEPHPHVGTRFKVNVMHYGQVQP